MTAIAGIIAAVLGVVAVVIQVLWERRQQSQSVDNDPKRDVEETQAAATAGDEERCGHREGNENLIGSLSGLGVLCGKACLGSGCGPGRVSSVALMAMRVAETRIPTLQAVRMPLRQTTTNDTNHTNEIRGAFNCRSFEQARRLLYDFSSFPDLETAREKSVDGFDLARDNKVVDVDCARLLKSESGPALGIVGFRLLRNPSRS